MVILKTPEGKKVDVNYGIDTPLYESPHNPPNTGSQYTCGDDLYVHKTRKGNLFYYIYHWSMWQGEEESYTLVSEDEARNYLIECAGYSGWGEITSKEMEKILKYFPDIFEEDA